MAEVSGPGQFSKRTDKAVGAANSSLPDAGYGEAKEYNDLKSSAPLAKDGGGNVDFASLFGNPGERVIPMGAASSQPGVPITDGAALGAGAGMEALGLADQKGEDLQRLAPYLPVLEFMANQEGASWAMRNLVRKVKSVM